MGMLKGRQPPDCEKEYLKAGKFCALLRADGGVLKFRENRAGCGLSAQQMCAYARKRELW
jgi:hypothetical protein